MADIVKTSRSGSGSRGVVITTLGASDSFTFAVGDELHIENNTGNSLTPLLTGDAATTTPVSGYGNIDVSGGYSSSELADGDTQLIPLDSIKKYLVGVVNVTGADGATVYIISN